MPPSSSPLLPGSSMHPLSPRRLAVLPPDPTPADAGLIERGRAVLSRAVLPLRPNQVEQWQGWSLSAHKVDLIIRLVDRMVSHYGRTDLWELWLRTVARREDLGTTGIGGHIAILDYRLPEAGEADEPPVDWWVFLVPEGCDWDALDGIPVHVIFGVTGARPDQPGMHLRNLERLCQVLRRREASDWVALSRMEPLDAVRWFNALHAEVEQDRAGTAPG